MRSGTPTPVATAALPAAAPRAPQWPAALTHLNDAGRAELERLVEYAVPVYPLQMLEGKEYRILHALLRGVEQQRDDAIRAHNLERAARLERTARLIDREMAEQEFAADAARTAAVA